MSLAHIAADELVSTSNIHEKLYNDHENLKETMLEMEKKLRQLERTVASQNEELSRLYKTEKEWSPDHILRETEDEWAKENPDTDKIKKLDAKYEAAYQISKLKNRFWERRVKILNQ